jgi:hypothetical protein
MPSHLLKWCLIACRYTRSDQRVARLNWYFIYIALCRNTVTRNKYRHVIAHSSNVGSSKLQQFAVLGVIVDILEVLYLLPQSPSSFLRMEATCPSRTLISTYETAHFLTPKSIILIFSAVKTSQACWQFMHLLELFMVSVNCFCYIWI